MHTIIPPLKTTRRSHRSEATTFRKPHYDCQDQADTLRFSVVMPEVDEVGVELIVRGPDFIIRGHKRHVVRVNWQALHLEGAQHDYELRLRLGHGLDYDALEASLENSVLTVTIPKRVNTREVLRRVA